MNPITDFLNSTQNSVINVSLSSIKTSLATCGKLKLRLKLDFEERKAASENKWRCNMNVHHCHAHSCQKLICNKNEPFLTSFHTIILFSIYPEELYEGKQEGIMLSSSWHKIFSFMGSFSLSYCWKELKCQGGFEKGICKIWRKGINHSTFWMAARIASSILQLNPGLPTLCHGMFRIRVRLVYFFYLMYVQ